MIPHTRKSPTKFDGKMLKNSGGSRALQHKDKTSPQDMIKTSRIHRKKSNIFKGGEI